MRQSLHIVIAFLVTTLAFGGELIDRIVATVNGHIIMASDVHVEVEYQCLLAKSECNPTEASEKAALDRLIERELLDQQLVNSTIAKNTPGEVDRKLAELKHDLVGSSDQQQWLRLLARYSLAEEDVRSRVAEEIEELRFIDLRFRRTVQISPEAVQQYYNTAFVPKLPAGAAAPEFSSVSGKIRELLTQQAITTHFTQWMAELRAQSLVEVH